MSTYYNENAPFQAAWLRELIKAGLIAPGDVDERSIKDVQPDDVRKYTQCHFFAGVGVWSYALRGAGYADDQPVWSGSCPCQPFSAAGKRKGTADDRHLWPEFFRLIRECQPAVIVGEQVASKGGLGWYDTVQTDLENAGYAIGAVDTCAAGCAVGAEESPQLAATLGWIQRSLPYCPDSGLADELRDYARWLGREIGDGAPHIRQRLYFVAESLRHRRGSWPAERERQQGRRSPIRSGRDGVGLADAGGTQRRQSSVGRGDNQPAETGRHESTSGVGECSEVIELAQSNLAESVDGGIQRSGRLLQPAEDAAAYLLADSRRSGTCAETDRPSSPDGLGQSRGAGLEVGSGLRGIQPDPLGAHEGQAVECPSHHRGFWTDVEWVYCKDEKYRPVKPGIAVLATGFTNRIHLLRGFGNSIVAPVAKNFIEAYLETRAERGLD